MIIIKIVFLLSTFLEDFSLVNKFSLEFAEQKPESPFTILSCSSLELSAESTKIFRLIGKRFRHNSTFFKFEKVIGNLSEFNEATRK